MNQLSISESKKQILTQKMNSLGIFEKDIQEEFIRGSGAGGQKINKTSSTVVLFHKPSGIRIRCQKTRSQTANRFFARRILVEKIEEKILGEKSLKQQKIEKIRRQKRKRNRRAKEKMLQNKKIQGAKKQFRQKPGLSD